MLCNWIDSQNIFFFGNGTSISGIASLILTVESFYPNGYTTTRKSTFNYRSYVASCVVLTIEF